MAKLKTVTIVVDTTPEKLGEFVTAKAWIAATQDGSGLFREIGVMSWSIVNGLPEIKSEWVRDAFKFFLSEENRERFEEFQAARFNEEFQG